MLANTPINCLCDNKFNPVTNWSECANAPLPQEMDEICILISFPSAYSSMCPFVIFIFSYIRQCQKTMTSLTRIVQNVNKIPFTNHWFQHSWRATSGMQADDWYRLSFSLQITIAYYKSTHTYYRNLPCYSV